MGFEVQGRKHVEKFGKKWDKMKPHFSGGRSGRGEISNNLSIINWGRIGSRRARLEQGKGGSVRKRRKLSKRGRESLRRTKEGDKERS